MKIDYFWILSTMFSGVIERSLIIRSLLDWSSTYAWITLSTTLKALEAKGLKQFRNDYSKWLKTKKSLELNLIENEDNLIKLPKDKFTTTSILDQIPLEPRLSSKELIDCWDKNRNFNIHPLTASKFSNKAAFFKCEKGHTWSTIIRHDKGCPVYLSAKKFEIKKGNQS